MDDVGGNFCSTSTDTTHANGPQMGADTGWWLLVCERKRERHGQPAEGAKRERGTEPFKQNDVVSYGNFFFKKKTVKAMNHPATHRYAEILPSSIGTAGLQLPARCRCS